MAKRSEKTFYITTPIYYVNDIPHIGHAYTTIIADTISRFKKLTGYDVFFLTGTDEHGQKVEKAAKEKGLTPIELADQMVVRYKDLWKALNIANDSFIRTTQSFHEKGVQKIFQKLKDKGDIYKGIYKGWYCDSTEHFLAEDVPLEEGGYKICPECNTKAFIVSEECYFFKLSAYQKPLLDFYGKNPAFVRPQSRMNEVISFVKQELKDLSITRTTVEWGIPVPDDSKHTIYVWFDALHNYLTGIGYDWDLSHFQKYWPATVHLIGKDILRFHAIFWPAFLLASDFPLPQTVFGHGWWLKDKTKMSKSKGNVLDPHIILKTFGADPLRYFLLREIPIGLDGNFSHEGFIHRVNSDLANDLGNLVQRTLTMIQSFFNGKIEETDKEGKEDKKLRLEFETTKKKTLKLYEDYAINKALEEIWSYINSVNKYLAVNEPWKLSKDKSKRKKLGRILYQAAAALRTIAFFLFPVMPESSEKIWNFLGEEKPIGEESFRELKFENLKLGQIIKKPEPLFPRIALKDFLKEEETRAAPARKEEKMEYISFDEFKKMDLRVGEILNAEKVEGTTKLLKLEVDIGVEKRTMVAGVADVYSPEDLTGKKVTVIVNLKPAVIRGIESQGMLLAAEIDDKATISFFDKDVPTGAKVR
ncbi:MAG: methionine--tRNA ligase [Candidatus Aminicenantes bacterium]|nr:methionine--tRNA ligase [Candidatus Aminicenantes bacterium]MBL7082081.1 methionine--tRNA ligase [Candidatus Aminicenantes bacterium]